MQKGFDNLVKLIFGLAAGVFVLAIVSSYFGYVIFIAILALAVALLGVFARRYALAQERIRDLNRDLDRARRRP